MRKIILLLTALTLFSTTTALAAEYPVSGQLQYGKRYFRGAEDL